MSIVNLTLVVFVDLNQTSGQYVMLVGLGLICTIKLHFFTVGYNALPEIYWLVHKKWVIFKCIKLYEILPNLENSQHNSIKLLSHLK